MRNKLYLLLIVFMIVLSSSVLSVEINNTNFPVLGSEINYEYARGYVFEAKEDGYIKQIQKHNETKEWPIITGDNLTAHIYVFGLDSTTTGSTTDVLVFNPAQTQIANASFSGNVANFSAQIPILAGQKVAVMVGSKNKLPWESDAYQSRYAVTTFPQNNTNFNLISEAMGFPGNTTAFRNRSNLGHNIVSIIYNNDTLSASTPPNVTEVYMEFDVQPVDGICYQETANETSTVCPGITTFDTGNYTFGTPGGWRDTLEPLMMDGNWSTGANADGNTNDNSFYVVYPIPDIVGVQTVHNAIWQLRFTNGGAGDQTLNYTIPSSCMSGIAPGFIHLKWDLLNDNGGIDQVRVRCYSNPTTQVNLYTSPSITTGTLYGYEEAIYWNLTYVPGQEYAIPGIDDMVGYCNATDNDSLSVSYFYNWFVNDISVNNGSSGYYEQGVTQEIASLNNSLIDIYDEVIFSCRAFDGINYSSWLNSSIYTMNATAPAIETSRIEPVELKTSDNILGYCNASQNQNNPVSYYYDWFINNVSVLSGKTETKYCLQETADISTTCDGIDTGLDTGSYAELLLNGTLQNSGNWYDGNYETATNVNGYAGTPNVQGRAYLYVNYTVPSAALSNSIWSVAYPNEVNPDYSPQNYTIPSDCMSGNTLQFRIYIYDNYYTFGVNHVENIGQCLNNTNWITLFSNLGEVPIYDYIYEEAVYWNMPALYTENVEELVSTLNSGNTSEGDEIIFSCLANSNPNSTWLNSSPSYVNYIPVTETSNIDYQSTDNTLCLQEYHNQTANCQDITTFDTGDVLIRTPPTYWTNYTNIYDGNYDTYAYRFDSNDANYLINYTVPNIPGVQVVNDAIWQIKFRESGSGIITKNYTLSDYGCFDETYPEKMKLDIASINGGTDYLRIRCWVGTYPGGSILIENTQAIAPGDAYLYEEAIIWNITYVIPQNETVFSNADLLGNCNVTDNNLDENISYYYNWYINDEVILSGISEVPPNYCYQETATTITSCGGLSSGSYQSVGDWNAANVYDGIDVTSSSCVSGTCYLYMNYTKPNEVLNNSLWQVIYAGGIPVRENVSFSNSCWNYDNTKLVLRVRQVDNVSGNFNFWDCYTGSSWDLLLYGGDNVANEEGIYWKFATEYPQGVEQTISVLNSTFTSINDEVIFECKGYDGLEYSSWLNSSIFRINNSLPFTAESITYPTVIMDYNNEITGACNVTDLDLQNINYSYIWYSDGVEIDSGTYNNVTQGALTNISTLVTNASQAFENLIFSCRGYDGYNYSDWLNSSAVYINNSVPVVEQAITIPDNETESSNDVVGACNATDTNDEQLSMNYNWFVNNVSVLTGTTTYIEGFVYQEFADSVVITNTTPIVNNLSLGIDGSYATYFSTVLGESVHYYQNYTVPFNIDKDETVWQWKRKPTTTVYTSNISFCLNRSIFETHITVSTISQNFECKHYNGSWIVLPSNAIAGQYNFLFEDSVTWKINNNQGVLDNVSTLNSSYINPGDEVIFSCQADDGVNVSSWLNSSILDIIFSQPIVNELYVTPIYPETATQLNCNFNTTDINPGIEYNVSVSWYKDGIIDNTYDYTYVNITDDILYTTANGNGSYTGALSNYSEYNCTINVSNGAYIISSTSTGIFVYPLENLTIISPSDNTYSNENLNTTFTVVDYNEGITCSLYVNDTVQNSKSVLSGTLSYLNYTLPSDGHYSHYVNCSSVSNTYTISSIPRLYIYDTTPPYITNLSNNQNTTTPEIDDTITLTADVLDINNVSYCSLYINDTGTFLLNQTQYVGIPSASISFNYTIQNYSTANMSHITWYATCNDSIGNLNVSLNNSFVVKDITYPNITATRLGVNPNNLSVISNYFYNMSYNITFMDNNLFQAFVNVSCDIDGDIYYWEILDINYSIYTKADTVDLSGYNPQKCYYSFGASDDHTKKKIKDYELVSVEKGLEFETEAKNKIKISAKDNKNQYEKVKTKKEKDRYNFNFEFSTKELEREFEVYVEEGTVYYRPNSGYGGHFVIWNEDSNEGNWLDFQLKEPHEYLKYDVQKLADNHYIVRMYVDVPSNVKLERPKFLGVEYGPTKQKDLELYYYGMDNIEFDSIGGTNIEIFNYEFYIGGAVNVSGIDLYDNTTLQNISVNVTNIDTYPGVNGTQGYTVNGASGIIQNLSNGTYLFEFYKDNQFVLRDYVVNVNAPLVSQLYETAESVVTVSAINIKSGNPVYNAFISVNKNGTSEYRNATGDNTTSVFTFWLDADDYNITGIAPLYDTTTGAFSTVYMENKSFSLPMIFLTIFNLMDEKTIAPFNINSPDNVNFILICEDSQYTYQVTNQTQEFPIICNYTQFKFDLEYAGESYYRKLIIDPDIVDNIFNQTVWLIDLNTTTAIYNSIFIDDLLQDYDDTQIFVYKIIDDTKEQITADFTDVEGKIGAYLIRNHEYIIEVHSSNNPIRVMGSYSADLEGDKTVRLYDISTGGNPIGFANDVYFSTQTQNISGTMYATASYSDSQNATSSVTWTLYEGEFGGPVLFTTTITRPLNGSTDFTGLYNISQYENDTVISHMTFVHDVVGTNRYSRILQQANEIPLEIVEFVGQSLINWFFTLLIGLLAIMATIRTGNLISMFLVLAASLFVIFGWFQLSVGILALAALVALMAIIKGGTKAE